MVFHHSPIPGKGSLVLAFLWLVCHCTKKGHPSLGRKPADMGVSVSLSTPSSLFSLDGKLLRDPGAGETSWGIFTL